MGRLKLDENGMGFVFVLPVLTFNGNVSGNAYGNTNYVQSYIINLETHTRIKLEVIILFLKRCYFYLYHEMAETKIWVICLYGGLFCASGNEKKKYRG